MTKEKLAALIVELLNRQTALDQGVENARTLDDEPNVIGVTLSSNAEGTEFLVEVQDV